MDELGCPRCKTTKYRVPSLKLMVNLCGHALCDSCIELLFVKGAAACPECGIVLRRGGFRIQLFEDVAVEKEIDIRRRVLKDFNKRETDFSSLREYNDYLEELEDIIFNLVNNIDIIETNKKIEQYKKENKEQIAKGKSRPSDELLELEAIIEEEKLRAEHLYRTTLAREKEEKMQKIKTREALIDDLMFSETDAKAIVALHKDKIEASKELSYKLEGMKQAADISSFSTSTSSPFQAPGRTSHFTSGIQIGTRNASGFLPIPKVEEVPLYQYEEPQFNFSCPPIPSLDSLDREHSKYLTFIKSATVSERAGGYHSKISCRRALQDAFSDIAFQAKLTGIGSIRSKTEPMDYC